MKNSLLLFMLFLSTFSMDLKAQSNLFLDNSYTVEEMVNDFFNNPNVTVSNINFLGDQASIAFFDADGTDLSIGAGIVFTTGEVMSIANNAQEFASTNLGFAGDADLDYLSMNTGNGLPSQDATTIEFDFMVNQSDSLHFKYIFASEEYPEFTCSSFNDAFAFFVSGPGLSGPFTNEAENITTVPGSDLEVSIDHINGPSLDPLTGELTVPVCAIPEFEQYYVDNINNEDVIFDGRTVTLPASFYAMEGNTYHAKLVIGDRGDGIFDSGVFLSFASLGVDTMLPPPTSFGFVAATNEVTFSNQSKYARAWDWDFGNGEISNERHPDPVYYSEAGTYTVSLTAHNFCCSEVFTQDIVISELIAVSVSVESTNTELACNGDQNASISLNVNGGLLPYTIEWEPAIDDFDAVGAGTYIYTVIDANEELVTGAVIVTEPSELELIGNNNNEIDVQSNGSATVEIIGGTPPYEYLWSNGATTATIENLPADNYTVNVIDGNGCSAFTEVFVESIITDVVIIPSTSNNPLACNGDANAMIDLELSGGVAPYDVVWSPAITNGEIGAGTYVYVVTDAHGNGFTGDVVIDEPMALFTTIEGTAATGTQSNGTAAVTALGGTAPYSYLWSNSATTPSVENLVADDYTATVTDANGCESINFITVAMVTNILETTSNFDLSIFPNPVKEHLFIENTKEQMLQSMDLFNAIGQRFEASYQVDGNLIDVQIPTELSKGIYYIRIQWKDATTSVGRFVKE